MKTGRHAAAAKKPRRAPRATGVAAPAKITAPQLSLAHPRPRLFKILDDAARRPVVWITAPGGAGKTTLAASYAQARKRPCCWHQLDTGDADVASYFHYARLAVANASRRRCVLPDFTPEYFADLPVFARRFFEAAGAQLAQRSLVVIDSYQEVAADAALHEVLAAGIDQIPAGTTVLVLSRDEPPPAFAAARARGLISIIGPELLRFNEAESIATAKLLAPQLTDIEAVRQLHAQTGGWVAALVLLLEPLAFGGELPQAPAASRAAIFDFLGREFLDRAPAAVSTLLLRTACLPLVSGTAACALAGDPAAAQLLERLAAQSYLVSRRMEREPVYQYHPLLAEFLQRESATRLDALTREALILHGAELLEAEGHIEPAAALLERTEQWPALIQLALRHAPALARDGRLQTLATWLSAIPASLHEAFPFVLYWLGVCRMPFSFAEARSRFETAYKLFRANADRPGALLAWSGVVDTYTYDWGDMTPLGHWLAELNKLLAESSEFPTPEIGERVTISAFSALLWRQPSHPNLARWEQGVLEVARSSSDAVVRAGVGYHLVLYYAWWLGDHAKAEVLIDMLAPVLAQVRDQPLAEISWNAILAVRHWMRADNTKAVELVEHGLARADASGVHVMDFLLCVQGAWAALALNDLPLARRYLTRMRGAHGPAQILHAAHYHLVAHVEAWKRGADAEAAEHVATGLALTERAGAPFCLAMLHQAMGRRYLFRGECALAEYHLERSLGIGEGFGSIDIPRVAWYSRAEMALRTGDSAQLRHAVREFFALSARHDYLTLLWVSPTVVARLCEAALTHDIEPAFVRRLIERNRIEPPESALRLEAWPRPLKICALGDFTVAKDGAALVIGAKSQKKPLELLKALIALGGENIKESRLTEILWPDSEGDAAHSAFTTTLSRLRKLVGEQAISVQEGRVSLDQRHVWVDALALDQILETGDDAPDAAARVAQALSLYRGALLAGDDELAWVLGPRERLRHRFVQLLARAGARLAGAGQHAAAIELYRRGIDLDALAEEFYRELMKCHLALGERAQAAAVYRRCRQALAHAFGDRIELSPAIQALYKELGLD